MAWCWFNATESKPQNVVSNRKKKLQMNNLIKPKSKIFLLIITSFFFSCKENKEHDLKRFDLNGNVETVSYIYKEASEKFGKVIEGKIIADSLITMTFNSKGQLTDSTWNNHKYSKKIEYERDLRKKETYFSNKFVISHKEFLYTTSGKISEKTNFDKSKKIVEKKIYTYNQNSSTLKSYNANGDLVTSEILKYDTSGNLIEIIAPNRKTTFKYLDDLVSEKIVIQEKYEEKDANLYDDYSSIDTYKQTYIKKSNYDKNGNISKYCAVNKETKVVASGDSEPILFNSETILHYNYQSFDKLTNWTKQIVRSEYGIDHLIKRKISYRKENRN